MGLILFVIIWTSLVSAVSFYFSRKKIGEFNDSIIRITQKREAIIADILNEIKIKLEFKEDAENGELTAIMFKLQDFHAEFAAFTELFN
jgi:hypothetical protein